MTLRKSATKPRQRWALLVGAVAALTLVIAGVALAVHGEDFQLDGDVSASTITNIGITPQTVDWDSLINPNGTPKTSLPTGFGEVGFNRDFRTNPGCSLTTSGTFCTADQTTFATGSKDTLPISGWQCNFDNNVNSKIDVMNSYAATYTADNGDEIIYFALERNTNTGTANVAFWFLQSPVGCNSTGGAVDFTGGHTDGDLLIVSAFSGGGTVSSVDVYRWVGDDATGHLNPTPVFTGGVDCRTTSLPATDSACGAANTATITTPWLTASKLDGVGHSLRTALFFEGGVNLTQTGLGGKCFNTFIGDTRSSTSLTATLFDYAGGQLGSCESGTVTTPNIGSAGATIPGDPADAKILVNDTAVITVSGASTFDATVSFHLCGPTALTDPYVLCATGGVDAGSVPVTTSGSYQSSLTANFVTSAGKYCWRADFSGDTVAGVPPSSDSSVTECFTINPLQSTLTTQASGPVALGQKISDTVNLSNTAHKPGSGGAAGSNGTINATTLGLDATGAITVVAYGPNSCSTVAFTSAAIAASGNGSYGGATTAFEFTPTLPGEYVFVAAYAGDLPNTLGILATACSAAPASEKVTVSDTSTIGTAQKWVPSDSATVHSTGGAALSGSVIFTLYSNGTCTAGTGNVNVLYTSAAKPVSGLAGVDVTVTSGDPGVSVTATGLTTWSWRAVYTSSNNTSGSQSTCETTTLNITN